MEVIEVRGVARVAGYCLTDSISSKLCDVHVYVWAAWFSDTCTESHTGQTSDVLGHVGVVERRGAVKVVVQETRVDTYDIGRLSLVGPLLNLRFKLS